MKAEVSRTESEAHDAMIKSSLGEEEATMLMVRLGYM